jgi:hypothetical protein
MPRLQARLDELSKVAELNKIADQNKANPAAPALPADQQKEFVEITTQLKLLDDRRKLLLARTGDDYVTDPPKLPAKP